MANKILSASEVAKKILQMFPPTNGYWSHYTCVFGSDGNSVIEVNEFKSGISRVSGYPCCWKTYPQLNKEEKQQMIDNINSMKVDIVIRTHQDGFQSENYWVAGAYEEYMKKHQRDYVAGYEIKPFNY